MATRRIVLTLDVTAPRDEWCDGCLTSSLVVCDVLRLTAAGVSTLATYRRCWRCEDGE